MSTKITIELIVADSKHIHADSVRDVLSQALVTRRGTVAEAVIRQDKREVKKILSVIDKLKTAFDNSPLIKVEACSDGEEDE